MAMKAWHLIEKPGSWCQKHLHEYDANNQACSHCLYGALLTMYKSFNYEIAEAKVKCAIGEDFITWNDDPKRKQEEVVALLKRLDL